MRFFLRLKHWQLFVITWGVPVLIDVFVFSDPELIVRIFPFMMVIWTFCVFGWVWSISFVLHNKLPENVNLKLGHLKFLFSVPLIYMGFLLVWTYVKFFDESIVGNEDAKNSLLPLILTLHLISMLCILLGLRFAAKTMKSIELGRNARFGDYAGEFFLIWFSFMGIWILQPRLNKLTE